MKKVMSVLCKLSYKRKILDDNSINISSNRARISRGALGPQIALIFFTKKITLAPSLSTSLFIQSVPPFHYFRYPRPQKVNCSPRFCSKSTYWKSAETEDRLILSMFYPFSHQVSSPSTIWVLTHLWNELIEQNSQIKIISSVWTKNI